MILRGYGLTDEACPAWISGQHDPVAVGNERRGARWQGKANELLSQPVEAERHRNHAGDVPVLVPEWLRHMDRRLFGDPADAVAGDDEAGGPQGECKIVPFGHVQTLVERVGRAADMSVEADYRGGGVARRLFQQVGRS